MSDGGVCVKIECVGCDVDEREDGVFDSDSTCDVGRRR